MARLPEVGEPNWGDILNEYLLTSHNEDGTLQAAAVAAVLPDATDTEKGVVQLAGDLGGTADAPTVPALSAHVGAATGAHAASAISVTPAAPLTATDVQGAFNETAGLLPARSRTIPLWEGSTFDALTHWPITVEGVTMQRSVVNRRARVSNTNSGATTMSNMRHWFVDSSFQAMDSEVTTLLWGGAGYTQSEMFQQGNVHRAVIDGSTVRGFIAWPDIVLGSPFIINIGVWEGNGASMSLNSGLFIATGLPKYHQVSAATRNNNTVTLTLPLGHGIKVGDNVGVDLATNSFDGNFYVTAATATTVTYPQTGPNGSGGTGTAFSRNQLFPYWLKSRVVGNTISAKVWRYGEAESDWGDTTRAGSWTYASGNPAPPTSPGACGIYGGHIGNTHYVDFGQTSFTAL